MTVRINVPKPKRPQAVSRRIVGDLGGRAVHTIWTYGADSPFGVRVYFRPIGVTWEFARSLLFDGLTVPTGDGDVHFEPTDDDRHVAITLNSPDGEAEILFPIEDVRQFRNITYAIVAAGTEPEPDLTEIENVLRVAAEYRTGDGDW